MKRNIFLIIGVLFAHSLIAQFTDILQSDRPGQAFGPNAVGKYVFQLQQGFDFGGFSNNDKTIGTNFAPNTFLRYGFNKKIEINSTWEYRREKYDYSNSTNIIYGLSFCSIGTRLNIIEGKNNSPSVGILAMLKLPFLSSSYHFDYMAPRVMFIAGGNFYPNLSYTINLGIDFDGYGTPPFGIYVANIGYAISPKFSTFIENYGNFSIDYIENRWDLGIGFLASNNLLLDIFGGVGSNGGTIDYFTSIGVSWRITALRTKILNEQIK